MNGRLRLLLTALSMPQPSRFERVSPWLMASLRLLILMGADAYIAYAVWAFWRSAWAGDGLTMSALNPLSAAISSGLVVPALLLSVSISLLGVWDTDAARDIALALRRAISARDEAVAPIADAEALDHLEAQDDASAATETTLRVSTPILETPGIAVVTLISGVFLTLMAALVAVFTPWAILSTPARGFADPQILLQVAPIGAFGALSLVVLIIGARLMRRHRTLRRGVEVSANADGLTCRFTGSRRTLHTIAWGDARAVARMNYSDTRLLQHTIYLLDAGRDMLLWEAPPSDRYASAHSQQEATARQTDAQQLVALVIARTALPILNLSGAMSTLVGPATGAPALNLLNTAYFAAIAEHDTDTANMLWQMMDHHTTRLLSRRHWSPSEMRERRATLALSARSSAAQTRHAWLQLTKALLPYYPPHRETTPEQWVSQYLRSGPRSLNDWLTWNQIALVALALLASLASFWLK